ncbi:MAG: BlaI/MecI/CopY family transcriptional regulator [Ruminococcaceae bacterium]|nr:BlaI/MecI/CopY family transcriptional regulator [Oscillospiraceae bacterium]
MDKPKIFESEYRFCLILWEHEPINSTALAKLCKEELGWSKTTTYTVIRRLTDRGVVKSENAIVSAVISREEAEIAQIDELVSSRFGGSMPAFVAAFSKRQNLSDEKIAQILRIIEDGEDE